MRYFKYLLFVMLMINSFALAAELDGVEILKKTDENRIVGHEFAFEMEISSYRVEKLVDSYTLAGYVRIDDQQQTVKSLIYFLQPAQVKDRKMLMIGNEIWMHFPKTRNVIRLSPLQVLLGEISNGDIAQVAFSIDYDPVVLGKEDYNGQTCYRLELTVKEERKQGPYSKIILLVDTAELLPVYAEFYAQSGRKLKEVYYKDYQTILGKRIPMVSEVYDSIIGENCTVMQYKKLVKKSVPETYFRKEHLPRMSFIPLSN